MVLLWLRHCLGTAAHCLHTQPRLSNNWRLGLTKALRVICVHCVSVLLGMEAGVLNLFSKCPITKLHPDNCLLVHWTQCWKGISLLLRNPWHSGLVLWTCSSHRAQDGLHPRVPQPVAWLYRDGTPVADTNMIIMTVRKECLFYLLWRENCS